MVLRRQWNKGFHFRGKEEKKEKGTVVKPLEIFRKDTDFNDFPYWREIPANADLIFHHDNGKWIVFSLFLVGKVKSAKKNSNIDTHIHIGCPYQDRLSNKSPLC